MAKPPVFIFKQVVFDKKTFNPVYRISTNDLLCEVQIICGETVPVFIDVEVLDSNGILELIYSNDANTLANIKKFISAWGSKGKSKKRVKPQKKIKENIGYIWSTRFPTCEDNEATIYLIQILSNYPFSQVSLADSVTNTFTNTWEVIYFKMQTAGFEVAASITQGGIICCEMWKYLKSEFFDIEETVSEEDIWGPA